LHQISNNFWRFSTKKYLKKFSALNSFHRNAVHEWALTGQCCPPPPAPPMVEEERKMGLPGAAPSATACSRTKATTGGGRCPACPTSASEWGQNEEKKAKNRSGKLKQKKKKLKIIFIIEIFICIQYALLYYLSIFHFSLYSL
jgi:hypothetical protein